MNNISDGIVNTIEDMYKKAKCEVSKAFKTTVGLLQGCLPSPIEVYVLHCTECYLAVRNMDI